MSDRRSGKLVADERPILVREGRRELAERAAVELLHLREPFLAEPRSEDLLEGLRLCAMHDLGELLHQPALAVGREPRVAGQAQEPAQRRAGQADVEHRLHHTRHGHRRTRTHGNQQRALWITKAPSRAHAKPLELALEHLAEAIERRVASLEIGAAEPGTEHETRRDGKAADVPCDQVVRLRADHILGRQLVGPIVGDAIDLERVEKDGSPAHRMTSSIRYPRNA